MRVHSYVAAGALALIPMLALAAGQAASQPDQAPAFIKIDGQTIPVKTETHVIQTASGPVKVSSWSWHSPHGHSSFEMQTSSGGVPPAAALKQMQAMQSQMRAIQVNMMQMQQRMFALQQAAFAGFSMPVPQHIGFVLPFWGMPDPFVTAPVQHAQPASLAPQPKAIPAPSGPQVKA